MGVRSTLILVLAFSIVGVAAHGENDRAITIKIDNHSEGFEVAAWIHKLGGDRTAFTATAAQNVLESKATLSNDWFTEVDIKATGKLKNNGDEGDFGHWVQLRFTRDFQDSSYTIPVYFGNDRRDLEMDRLDDLTRNDKWEAYLRMAQIARYYQRKRHTDGFQRAARGAFYAAVTLTEEYTPYTILMSDEAVRLVSTAVGEEKSKSFVKRANLAKSAIWNDLDPMVQKYADKNDCDTVKLILKSYRTLKDREPAIFDASKQNPDVLKHLSIATAPRCPGLAESGLFAVSGVLKTRERYAE